MTERIEIFAGLLEVGDFIESMNAIVEDLAPADLGRKVWVVAEGIEGGVTLDISQLVWVRREQQRSDG